MHGVARLDGKFRWWERGPSCSFVIAWFDEKEDLLNASLAGDGRNVAEKRFLVWCFIIIRLLIDFFHSYTLVIDFSFRFSFVFFSARQ